MTEDAVDLSWREQAKTVYRAIMYRPFLGVSIVLCSTVAATLEGIGLTFLLPIMELAQNPEAAQDAGGHMGIFVQIFDFMNIPFSLNFVVLAVGIIFVIRFSSSFLVGWLRTLLREDYTRHLQKEAYNKALDAEIAYFDERGSDGIVNTIVTEAKEGADSLRVLVKMMQQSFLTVMYTAIAIYISAPLTILAVVLLGVLTYVVRFAVESGSTIGEEVAEANQRIHRNAQAGMQGIRDVKLFEMQDELYERYESFVDIRTHSAVKLGRNQVAMNQFYDLATILTLLVLIYWGIVFSGLSLSALGVFLFAMFRLAPRASTLNKHVYSIEGKIPHLYRTHRFLEELDSRAETTENKKPVPKNIDRIRFDNVSFSYQTGEKVLDNITFEIAGDEFAAFVGPSGAGKSTISSLLTRMYEPNEGEIRANGISIAKFDLTKWRSQISVVRQHPYIFDDTLRRNVTIADRTATQREIERVCEIAQVSEFLDELSEGYDTMLGEEGVRLSGGQKQRVALARALLKDAELLVLDEATSDLDANVEESVHQAIEDMDRDYAILVIAHRLSTVINADCIYTVEGGEIVESGTHSELITRDGKYSELYETQAQGV